MPFSEHDLHQVGDTLAHAARTEIMSRFRKLTSTQIRQKSSALDVVTDADEAAEAAMGSALAAAFAGALIVGEEATHRDPSLWKRSVQRNWHSSLIPSTAPRILSAICLCSE